MADSVYNSYKVIVVFSTIFLQSNYCSHELDLAKYRLLKERDGCLAIIRIDKTDYKKLPRGLKKRSFIDYASVLERPFWKSKLIKFLDIPSDCDNEYTSVEQDDDNNNSAPYSPPPPDFKSLLVSPSYLAKCSAGSVHIAMPRLMIMS